MNHSLVTQQINEKTWARIYSLHPFIAHNIFEMENNVLDIKSNVLKKKKTFVFSFSLH